jgi:amidase
VTGGTSEIVTSAQAAFVSRFDLGGDGPRIGIKDSIDIAGHPTRAASRALANSVPAKHHAAIVQALIAARWHIVGKTNMHELAYGVTGVNAWTGTPRNPRWPDRVPGGSSSGSAVAVAAGIADAAIGTDTGGSIRVPAACCGIIGLKPTFGRVSRDGVHPQATSLDCVGPLARTLPMIEQVMAVIDPTYRQMRAPSAVRLGYFSASAEPAIDAAVREYVKASAQSINTVSLPTFDVAFTAALTIIAAETWAAFGELLATDALGSDVRARLTAAREVTAASLTEHERTRARFIAEVDNVLEQVDVIALPTLPDYPLPLTAAGDAKRALRSTALVRQFNLSGHPALTLPLTTRDGLPAGLQLVGRRGGDAELCAAARHIHQEDFVCR